MPTNPYAPPGAAVKDRDGTRAPRLSVLRIALLGIATLGAALVGGVVAASAYRRWKYPGVQDTDGLLDIGAAFGAGFLGVSALLTVLFLALYLGARRRA
jgi:hypothetical protein